MILQKHAKEVVDHLTSNGFAVKSVEVGGNTHYKMRVAANNRECMLVVSCSPRDKHSAKNYALQQARKRTRG